MRPEDIQHLEFSSSAKTVSELSNSASTVVEFRGMFRCFSRFRFAQGSSLSFSFPFTQTGDIDSFNYCYFIQRVSLAANVTGCDNLEDPLA